MQRFFIRKLPGLLILALASLSTLAAPGCAGNDQALAKDVAELKQEVQALKAEIQELKKAAVLTEPREIQLPPVKEEAPLSPALVVSMLKDGKITLGDKVMTLTELKSELTRLAGENPNVNLVVQADSSIPHKKVVEVLETAKMAGIRNVAIGTKAKQE